MGTPEGMRYPSTLGRVYIQSPEGWQFHLMTSYSPENRAIWNHWHHCLRYLHQEHTDLPQHNLLLRVPETGAMTWVNCLWQIAGIKSHHPVARAGTSTSKRHENKSAKISDLNYASHRVSATTEGHLSNGWSGHSADRRRELQARKPKVETVSSGHLEEEQ